MTMSAFKSTVPALASGLISANAMKTMTAKPSKALNRISVNGTKVPSSLAPAKRSSSCIGAALQPRDHVDLSDLGDFGEQLSDRLVEEVVLDLEQKGAGDAGDGDVEGDRHAAAHAGECVAQRLHLE